MSYPMRAIVAAFSLAALTPHATRAQDSDRTSELYHIFDFKTDVRKGKMIAALTDGLHINVSDSQTTTPIVMEAAPEKAARFELVDPMKSMPYGGLAGLMGAAQAARFKQVTCDGAVWIANAERRVRGAQDLRLTMCLFPYAGGYQLDVYGIDVSQRGGGVTSLLGRAIGTAIVGKTEVWTNRTILDLVRSVRAHTGAQVSYVEGQPDLPADALADLSDAPPLPSSDYL